MKIPAVSGIVLLGTTLLAGSCSAAQDAVPSQYALTARMSSRWFGANGELLSSNQISVRISVDSDRAVIQPWASDWAVRYRAHPGAWPEINSQEFDKLIEANVPWPPPAPFGGR